MIKKIILLIAVLWECGYCYGSNYPKFRNAYWQYNRKELIGGIGASNFLGEPGGRDQIGTDFIHDLEFSETKYAIEIGFRYFVSRDIAIKGSFYHGMVSGNDALTQEPGRNNRNISFKSPIYELSALVEYHMVHEKEGARYKFKGVKGYTNFIVGIHPFIGVGITHFQPKGEQDGIWYNLHPLNTEGQNLEGGSKPYKLWTVVIPIGLGLRYSLNTQMKLGLEMGVRKTFSDYIDDTGGKYYDNATLLAENGELSAHFADPSLGKVNSDGNGNIGAGEIRGSNDDKDAYMFAVLSVNYILPKRRYRRIKRRGRPLVL